MQSPTVTHRDKMSDVIMTLLITGGWNYRGRVTRNDIQGFTRVDHLTILRRNLMSPQRCSGGFESSGLRRRVNGCFRTFRIILEPLS